MDLVQVKTEVTQIKTDLIQVKTDLYIEIEKVRGEIKDSRNEMLKWFVGIAITSVGAMTGFMALLLKYFIAQ